MTHAYDKNYLARAQVLLAVMFDFAVYDLNETLDLFYKKFTGSEIARRFEVGDTSTLAGKSGVELALEVTEKYSKKNRYRPVANRSPEFWVGWALAYFQWYSGQTFLQITDLVSINEILDMYNPYHEMDITHFCEQMLNICSSRKTYTNLKKYRTIAGLSQSELSKAANVSVRTIQQYEQRQKNINAAKAETVVSLARILGCTVDSLLEMQ